MIKTVLDTNVWLSGTFWKGEAYKLIKLAEKSKLEIIITKKILLEITKVLKRKAKFQRFLKSRNERIEDLLRTILKISRLISSESEINVIKEDSEDNKFLEAAVDGGAEYIISYDHHLLDLKEFKGVEIVSPKRVMETVRNE